MRALAADALANVIRNVWAHAIIFCGHFPDQTYTFTPEEVENEARGDWYLRQLVGAANIDGSPLFMSSAATSGYQVEHHLYPDMPAPVHRDRAEDQGHLRALRAAVQLRTVSQAVVHGAPQYLSLGFPGREAAAEAR